MNCTATFHVFASDSGNIDFGKEVDMTALYPLTDRVKLGGKLAHFMMDDVLTDTTRAMAWINFRLL